MKKSAGVSVLLFMTFCCVSSLLAQQKIKDFYLSNYAEGERDKWELIGQTATIFDTQVLIEAMKAKYFQKNGVVDIKADRATLNKENMDIRLEDNVEVENSQGMRLNTTVLNWEQSSNTVTTDEEVTLDRSDLRLQAQGLDASTDLSRVNFQKEVKVDLIGEDETIKINCDGPLEIDYDKDIAIFHNNVVVESSDGKLFAQRATAYFSHETETIAKIVAEGDVKVIRDDNVTFAEKAVYSRDEKKIILEGKPRLVIFPDKTEGFKGIRDANTGN